MNRVKTFFKKLFKNKQSLVGFIILLIFAFMAILGPEIVPEPTETNYANRLQAPSLEHPFGTDYAGRDTFGQFIHGSRNVLLVAIVAAIITIALGFIIGTISGVAGGIVDEILMMVTGVMLTVPSFPIMMILSMVIKISNPLLFGLILSLWSWAGLARSIRAQILSLKYRDFIEASRVLGMGTIHIIFKEMLPNMVSYVLISFINIMKSSITASVGLMVLGLVPFSAQHWGIMINLATTTTGAMYGSSALIYFLVPVFGIMFFQIGCLLFANGLDDALNPKLSS